MVKKLSAEAVVAARPAPPTVIVHGDDYATAFPPGLDLDRSSLRRRVGML